MSAVSLLRTAAPLRTGALAHIGYWAAALAIMAMGVALHGTGQRSDAAAARVDRSLDVLDNLAGVRAGMARAESAQHGFLLSGEGRFHDERDAAVAGTRAGLADLAPLVEDNFAQERRLRALRALVNERVRVMAESDDRPPHGEVPVRVNARGEALGERIAASLDEMRAEEVRLLGLRRADQRDAHDRSMLTLLCALAVALAVMVAGYAGFARELRRRDAAEQLAKSLAQPVPAAIGAQRADVAGGNKAETELPEPGQHPAGAPPLDRAVLAEISGGDPALEREILARFHEVHADHVVQLVGATAGWDLVALRDAAHGINVSARALGAMPVAAACWTLEAACREQDMSAARGAMAAMTQELQRLDAALHNLSGGAPTRHWPPERPRSTPP